MPSQFFGLNIAYKGLLASNASLNTTYNNISNEQTEGYSRQQAVQTAGSAAGKPRYPRIPDLWMCWFRCRYGFH